ncbi:MAG: type IV secretion system DNA-binding domain-containing protein [Candidatus Obscuribacterales bacterium]
MIRQVIRIALIAAVIAGGAAIIHGMFQVHPLLYRGSLYYWKAKLAEPWAKEITVDPAIWSRISYITSPRSQVSTYEVIKHTEPYYHKCYNEGIRHLKRGGVAAAGTVLMALGFFLVRGGLSHKKEHLSGRRVMPARRVAWLLKLKRQASDVRLGGLPLVKGTETQHLLVTGGTGSGKTNCFHHLIPQIEKRGDRMIILDVTGSMVERYYRPGDALLNPMDPRGLSWHPWAEGQDALDFASISEGFIPVSHSEHENYWRTAARALMSALLEECQDQKATSELYRLALKDPLADLCRAVQHTDAGAFLDIQSEKMAGSVRSVAASFLRCLKYVEDTGSPFSIREWVADSSQGQRLFICCRPSERAALAPLLSCWFSIAVRSLLHLDPSFDRRIWYIVDELPTLNKVKELETFVAEGRKYGGCGLFALQSPSQLEAIYGQQGAQTLMGNCATRIVFFETDPTVASSLAKVFGEQEIREYQEGISYGAHQMRDGVSLSRTSRYQPSVSPSDIQALASHECYVRLPGNFPIAKVVVPLSTSRI